MRALSRAFWGALAVVLFCFALLAVNQRQVALEFLAWQTPEISVFWWLLVAFLLGVVASALVCGLTSIRMRMRQRALSRELDASRRELERLRNLTFQD